MKNSYLNGMLNFGVELKQNEETLLKKTQKIIRRKIKKDNIARWLCLEKRKFDFSNREIEKKRREQNEAPFVLPVEILYYYF